MNSRRPAKNPHAEAEQFRRRAALGFIVVALVLAGLAAWYFRLQVLQHADYATLSEANRIRPRPVVPARGMIYDRQGRLLAENLARTKLAERAVEAVGANTSRTSHRVPAGMTRKVDARSDERTKPVDENPGISRQQVTAVEALRVSSATCADAS